MQQECVCCGITFDLMSELFDHMKEEHTEAEVLSALSQQDSQGEAQHQYRD